MLQIILKIDSFITTSTFWRNDDILLTLFYFHDNLTGLDTKYQPWTQQKKILVFEFVASYELTIDKDSLDRQIFHPCPPLGIGHPIFGQNRVFWAKMKNQCPYHFVVTTFFKLWPNINPLKVRKILHLIFLAPTIFWSITAQKPWIYLV